VGRSLFSVVDVTMGSRGRRDLTGDLEGSVRDRELAKIGDLTRGNAVAGKMSSSPLIEAAATSTIGGPSR
jgi:hypothetical protein